MAIERNIPITTNYTDQEILALISNEATVNHGFKALMTMYQQRLYWTIIKIVLTHEHTDDVLQNTFIKAFRALKNFEERSSLYTWLHKIAVNEALNLRKQEMKKHSIVPIENSGATVQAGSTDGYEEEEMLTRLHNAINSLPDKQKEVFSLRYFEEMSYQDISDKLGTSVGALKASFHHAIKKVETHLTN